MSDNLARSEQAAGEISTNGHSPVLRADTLNIGYGQRIVVEDLSLELLKGQITALVGPNGSGKSTLLKTLARLLKPSTGAVYLNGKAISRMPTSAVAQEIAVLPQGPVAPAGLTVGELVEQGRYPHAGPLRMLRQQDYSAISEAMRLTGMEDFAHRAARQPVGRRAAAGLDRARAGAGHPGAAAGRADHLPRHRAPAGGAGAGAAAQQREGHDRRAGAARPQPGGPLRRAHGRAQRGPDRGRRPPARRADAGPAGQRVRRPRQHHPGPERARRFVCRMRWWRRKVKGVQGAVSLPGVWGCPPITSITQHVAEGVQGSPCRGFGGVPKSLLTSTGGQKCTTALNDEQAISGRKNPNELESDFSPKGFSVRPGPCMTLGVAKSDFLIAMRSSIF